MASVNYNVTAALMAAILMTFTPSLVRAHGRMINPPSRMSAWRFGFDVPTNYNDHEQYCGGFANQWNVNGGKCGICGDPWQGPRRYERPGGSMVPKLVITKTYKTGQVIDVNVEVTVNHLGWFEFRLCDVRQSGGVEATQACLDRHVLADRQGKTRFDIGTKKGIIKFKLVLPPGLSCPQCVMQWKWHCGNNVGYGERQEEFYACSDVTITSTGATVPPPVTPPSRVTTTPLVIVTRPPVRITTTPHYVTNPPPVTQFPPTQVITDIPRFTLPPYLLQQLADNRRPLSERIQIYADYQKTRINGYNIWDESKLAFKSRYDPRKDEAINRLQTNNNNNMIYNNGYNNNNNGYNNNNNGYPNNNNGYNNNNNPNESYCRLCRPGCGYNDCTRLCPVDCPPNRG